MTNKDVVRFLFEGVYNSGNFDLADELLDPEYVGHNPIPGQPPKVEGFKWAMRHLRNAFPGFQVTIESLTAEDDRVVAQLTAHGTQRGPFQGLPPSDRKAEWQGIRIFRLANSRIVEHWGIWDTLSMLQQLTTNDSLKGGAV